MTLVLDAGYQPVARVTWQKAVTMVCKRVVDVVDEYPDRYIKSEKWQIKMPSVIRIAASFERKKAIKFSRHNVFLRDKGRCQYCGTKCRRDDWEYEHVTPRSQGGKTTFENIVVACTACNQRKGGRTPAQAGMRLLSLPVRPKSLPDTPTFVMTYSSGMPELWKDYLRSSLYWEGSLEQD